jgi:hypothetical protein
MPEGEKRDSAMLTVFRNAATTGYVNDLVLQKMRTALKRERLDKVFGKAFRADGSVDIKLLPTDWRRNVEAPGRRTYATKAR